MSILRPIHWAKKLISGAELVAEDIRAVRANDPAARSTLEVALVYPGVHALWLHRVSHALWERDWKLSARALAYANRFATGIEIHPGARIGRGVFIDHGMGIVIGETATIGDGCLLYKGVVLGGTSLERKVRHAQVGKDVVIGTNACILGAIHVGDRARIGAGSVVVRDVPAEASVVGVPARLIQPKRSRLDAALDHANLADPVIEMVRALSDQNETLRERVAVLEGKLGVEHDDHRFDAPYDGVELPRADGG
ncbi:MAG TPA: serine O-acetyltransferase [Polyangiaceae bacterium]|nr:serine O-acetyltransferase [Polyangiaceae bacterium]